MNFEEVLLEAIDEGFSWLGEMEKRTIYFYLEIKYNISKHNIPYRIEDFTEAIEDIFGVGAKVLEIRIMKNLFSKIGYPIPYHHNTQEGLEFTKYIEAARENRNLRDYFKASNTNEVEKLSIHQSATCICH